MTRFEYKTVQLSTGGHRTIKLSTGGFTGGNFDEATLDEYMNHLGDEGWELVCAFDAPSVDAMAKEVVAIFKRQK